jgi:hypothetical protein
MENFVLFRERPTTISLDKIKRELITTTATEDGKFSLESQFKSNYRTD